MTPNQICKYAVVSGIFAIATSGCLSMQSQSTLDAIQGAMGPYVEAYIEYPGPAEKFAGPANFILHVTAKDNGMAQVMITPALFPTNFQTQPPQMASNRMPSSIGMTLSQPKPKTGYGMSGEAAREKLSHLMTALQGSEQPFRGCMYPVRVRLIRADGAVTEKHGCRGMGNWTKASSELVNDFLTASVYGMPAAVAVTPDRAPASSVSGSALGKMSTQMPARNDTSAKGK